MGIYRRLSPRATTHDNKMLRLRAIARRAARSARYNSSSAHQASKDISAVPEPPVRSVAPAAPQAPNYPDTWSASQKSRADAFTGPRFEQTVLDLQPKPLSAMQLVSEDPIRIVHGRKAVCDGGASPTLVLIPFLTVHRNGTIRAS